MASRRAPLQMSLSAAQIFIRSEDFEAIEQILGETLVEWSNGVGVLGYDENGDALPTPERRVVLLPPHAGFITIIEENGHVDLSLARRLHVNTGVLVVAAQLDGHFLRAICEVWQDDGEQVSWESPPTPEDDTRMPIYEDVEAGLYERLRDLGVPSRLIATDWEELLEPDRPVATGARIGAEAGVEGLTKTLLPVGDLDSFELVEGPRVKPDLWVAGPEGDAQVVEARRVTGEWHTEAIQALARIEEEQLERILSTLAWTTDDERLPQVSFRYDGVEDETFFIAFDVLRKHRPKLTKWTGVDWSSVKGLVSRLRRASQSRSGELEIGLECGRRVEVRSYAHPAWSFFVDLDALWRSYLATPDAIDAIIDARLATCTEPADLPLPFELDRLVPIFLGEGVPGLSQLAARPFVNGVWTTLAIDTGDAIGPVTREALRESGVGFDDALERAIGNLDRLTEAQDAFVLYAQPEGLTIRAQFADVMSGTRILSPAVRAWISQQLGDECSVAIPSRDVLIAAEGTRDARKWIEREVARLYLGRDLPLTNMLWTIQNGDLVDDTPVDLTIDRSLPSASDD